MIKTFVNIFINVFYSLHKAINLHINIYLKMITKKKIIRHKLIIIYIKDKSADLKIRNFVIIAIILLMIRKITIFLNNSFR